MIPEPKLQRIHSQTGTKAQRGETTLQQSKIGIHKDILIVD
jgi:hypothetical protein